MRNTWIGQPFEDFGGWTADFLSDLLKDPGIDQLRIGVAWVKRSGLSRLGPMLIAFRERGGHSEAIVGMDEGGATRQGLEDAISLFDDVRIFHDPASRTFHPKVYLAWGEKRAAMIVGSSNLTAGGLYSNYEASLLTETDFAEDGDSTFVQMMQSWFETIRDDAEVCLPLTMDILKQLSSDPLYRIGDESVKRSSRQTDDDSVTDDSPGKSLFGTSKSKKKTGIPKGAASTTDSGTPGATTTTAPTPAGATTVPPTASPPARTPPTAATPAATPPAAVPIPAGPPAVTLRWWKKMSASDAQHPPTTTSAVTGNLKLTQAGLPIDHETFFRHFMFVSEPWAGNPNARGIREEAVVPFEVTTMGTNRGTIPLKIDHADYRIASQNNVPTWLHWGQLQPVLAANAWVGAYVVIEKLSNGRYTLEITGTQP